MPLNFFYTTVQKSQKWPKTQIKGGPALNVLGALTVPYTDRCLLYGSRWESSSQFGNVLGMAERDACAELDVFAWLMKAFE